MILTVSASREPARPPETVFAARLGPGYRARFGMREGLGMRRPLPGGSEGAAIGPDGAETGRLPTGIRVLRPPADGAPGPVAAQGTGAFGGAAGLTMQTAETVGAASDRIAADLAEHSS